MKMMRVGRWGKWKRSNSNSSSRVKRGQHDKLAAAADTTIITSSSRSS
jgi:hypothetical protein